jgi:hypothetical protein
VAERRIDRDAWAGIVAELIARETRGRKATFARLVDVDPRTVTRWLCGDVDVSEGSVRDVARAVKRNPSELLVQVGYYRPDEVPTREPTPDEDDEAVRLIADSNLSPARKAAMLDQLLEMRKQDRSRRKDTIQWMLTQARGA